MIKSHTLEVKRLSFCFTVGLYLFFGLTLFDVMDAMTGVSFASFFFYIYHIQQHKHSLSIYLHIWHIYFSFLKFTM